LAPEALKNTNLKIMHRIVATDDRDSMGGAMNLDDIQNGIARPSVKGAPLVYAEKMDHPFHLQVMFDKTKEVPPPNTPEESDQIVREAMKGLDIVQTFDRTWAANSVCTAAIRQSLVRSHSCRRPTLSASPTIDTSCRPSKI